VVLKMSSAADILTEFLIELGADSVLAPLDTAATKVTDKLDNLKIQYRNSLKDWQRMRFYLDFHDFNIQWEKFPEPQKFHVQLVVGSRKNEGWKEKVTKKHWVYSSETDRPITAEQMKAMSFKIIVDSDNGPRLRTLPFSMFVYSDFADEPLGSNCALDMWQLFNGDTHPLHTLSLHEADSAHVINTWKDVKNKTFTSEVENLVMTEKLINPYRGDKKIRLVVAKVSFKVSFKFLGWAKDPNEHASEESKKYFDKLEKKKALFDKCVKGEGSFWDHIKHDFS